MNKVERFENWKLSIKKNKNLGFNNFISCKKMEIEIIIYLECVIKITDYNKDNDQVFVKIEDFENLIFNNKYVIFTQYFLTHCKDQQNLNKLLDELNLTLQDNFQRFN